MYLTKFPLNMTRRETLRMLASPYRMHAALSGSFPGDSCKKTEEGRLLWRVDRDANGAANLYIVSPTVPSLVGLDEQIGWPDLERQWRTCCYDGFLERIAVGQIYGFRLCANPVVSRSAIKNDKGDSKRIAHITHLHQMGWLVGKAAYEEVNAERSDVFINEPESRATRNGFEVIRDNDGSLQLVVSEMTKREFKQGAKARKISLATARFDGILRVTDAERMRHALSCGIGHGKSFGCGLLTLASASDQ